MLSHFFRTSIRAFSVPPVVKVLSLDARDTLITLKENTALVYSRFAKKNGLNIREEYISDNFLKNYKRMSISKPCFGFNSIGSQCWWEEVVASTILDCNPNCSEERVQQTASDLYNYYASSNPWMLVENNIRQTLLKLRLKGIILVVSSNFDSRLKYILRQFNLSDLFSMVILSGEVGYEKPDKRIFQLIFNFCELSHPSEILHIGDNYKNDFQGARNYGCKSLLFDQNSSCSSVEPFDRISRLSMLNLY